MTGSRVQQTCMRGSGASRRGGERPRGRNRTGPDGADRPRLRIAWLEWTDPRCIGGGATRVPRLAGCRPCLGDGGPLERVDASRPAPTFGSEARNGETPRGAPLAAKPEGGGGRPTTPTISALETIGPRAGRHPRVLGCWSPATRSSTSSTVWRRLRLRVLLAGPPTPTCRGTFHRAQRCKDPRRFTASGVRPSGVQTRRLQFRVVATCGADDTCVVIPCYSAGEEVSAWPTSGWTRGETTC